MRRTATDGCRCVYVGDDMVNAALVRNGYPQVATLPPDVKYQDRFLAAQREAREAGRGLWEHVASFGLRRASPLP